MSKSSIISNLHSLYIRSVDEYKAATGLVYDSHVGTVQIPANASNEAFIAYGAANALDEALSEIRGV